MNLLPYHSFTITTGYSPAQLLQVVREHVEPARWFHWGRKHKEFQGTVADRGFAVTRIIHYRNSFLPVVRGRFEERLGAGVVIVRMAPHPLVLAFMAIWFSVGSASFWLALRGMLLSGGLAWTDIATLAVPLGFVLFGWLLMWGGFWREARKARRILTELLSYDAVQPLPTSRE